MTTMRYDLALQAHLDWWKGQYPDRAELSIKQVADCLGVKAEKLRNDPSFPAFRDGRNFKVTVPLLARWQTDRALQKSK